MATSHSDALEKLKAYKLHSLNAELTPLERAAVRLAGGWGDKTRGFYREILWRYASDGAQAIAALAVIAACDAAAFADIPGTTTIWPKGVTTNGAVGAEYASTLLGIDSLIDWNAVEGEAKKEATAQPAEVPPDWRPKHPDAKLTPPEVAAWRRWHEAKNGKPVPPHDTPLWQRGSYAEDPNCTAAFLAALKAADDAEAALEVRGGDGREVVAIDEKNKTITSAATKDSVAVFISGRQAGKSELMRQRYAESIPSTPNDDPPPRYNARTPDEWKVYHEVAGVNVGFVGSYTICDPWDEQHPTFDDEDEAAGYCMDLQERRARAAVEKYRAAKAKECTAPKPHGQTPVGNLNTWGGNEDE